MILKTIIIHNDYNTKRFLNPPPPPQVSHCAFPFDFSYIDKIINTFSLLSDH